MIALFTVFAAEMACVSEFVWMTVFFEIPTSVPLEQELNNMLKLILHISLWIGWSDIGPAAARPAPARAGI